MSGLPRPLSKLPTPNAPLQQRAPSPEKSAHTSTPSIDRIPKKVLPKPTANGTSRGVPTPGVSGIAAPRPVQAYSSAPDGRPQTPQRQPLAPSRSPQSKMQPPGTYGAAFQKSREGSRNSSQEENQYLTSDTDPLSASPTSSKSDDQVQVSRKPRPSLSDRTVQSLSHIPPSPASAKRRDSFFAPQSPVTPGRPATSGPGQTPKPSYMYGSIRGTPGPRPMSPSKRPTATHPANTPARRTVSSTIPKVQPATSALPAPRGATSPTKPARPQSSLYTRPASTLHMRSQTLTGKPAPLAPSVDREVSKPRPTTKRTGLARPQSMIQKPTTGSGPTSISPPHPKPPVEEERRISSSSTALREQIARAKASHREAIIKAKETASKPAAPSFDLESHEDPFNQQPRDGKGLLRKRIDTARKDGRLNIAAMNFQEVPAEVMQMYDSSAMEASTVTWSECVDLVRFNAADNAIEILSDEVFPDKSPEELAEDAEGKGNQFGGIELLDLHGNLLNQIPQGLRRLERLTTLNLSRNKLDNKVFDTLVQIPKLRDLNLSFNNLTKDIPSTISQLTSLEVLNLQSNKLSILPSSLRSLSNLRILNVSDNRFPELPFDCMTTLPLTEIHAANNALTGALFPLSVSGLPRLQVLDVANNAIAALCFNPSLHLPALQRLDVSNNRVVMFPAIGRWTGLTSLLAEDNALEGLPPDFTELSNLRLANFSGNNIRALDEGIVRMHGLEVLKVAGNPLREKKFLTMNVEDIKREMEKRIETSHAAAGGTAASSRNVNGVQQEDSPEQFAM